jgi:hypothetical protein
LPTHNTNEINEIVNDAPTFPEAEESLERLHRAGWSVNCTKFENKLGFVWIVSGYNGENQVLTAASTRDEAWWQASLQARSVGMLARLGKR